ncbi:M23 family metallopeptidase [Streptomyces sp. gb1(2016)]|uniref:M23 family metallopeptidase n=1 Tax=Streptomyces sp. gb1(2016) TaxID=1828321 RepID=A0A652KI28_9ACTN|nr:M23 family metallopeptidase [Streptomyces sp. gb1(2016)]TXS23375.1 M23 family metallopeptidase [Streptomyces sp. gb1(2016)]
MSARRLPALLTRVFLLAFFALVLTGLFVTYPFPSWLVFLPLVLAWVAGIAGGRLASRDLKAARRDAAEVLPPVAGRWSAINSPADRVPSHGVHTYGQTYAIDIVAEKQERQERQAGQEGQGGQDAEGAAEGAAERPAFAWLWPLARRPEAFPAFGAPLFAVADAKVVTADDTQRDHLSRNSLLGLAYLLLAEGELRGLAGAHRVFGNRVVLDLGDGTYAAYAHVRRGSLQVRTGDTVRAGQRIARCGNSGNSTEPHVHFQLMDHPDLDRARGIPFRWRGIGVPANGEAFTAEGAVSPG